MRSRVAKHKYALAGSEALQRALDRLPERGLLGLPVPLDLLHGGVPELALPDQAQYLVDGALLALTVGVGPAAEPEALEAHVPEDQEGGGQHDGLLGHGAVCDEGAALAEALGHGGGGLAADAVEAEGDGVLAAAGELVPQAGREPPVEELGLGDDGGGAKVEQLAAQLLGGGLVLALADDVDAAQAPQAAQLDGGAADAAVGAVLDEPGASGGGGVPLEGPDGLADQVDVVAQHAVGAAGVDRHGGHLDGVEPALVDLEQRRLGILDKGVGAPRAKAGGGWDAPVALLQASHAGAHRQHLEAALVAGDGGRLGGADGCVEGGLGAVCALDGIHIGRVHGRGEGADEDRVGGDLRRDGVVV